MFSLAGTLATVLLRSDSGWIAPATALLTLALGCFVVGREYAEGGGWLPVAGVALFGGIVEGVGVSTEWPFGPYEYTSRWFPTLGGFPLQVPLAWAVVTLASLALARRLWPAAGWLNAPLAGLIAASVDFVMEPVMTGALGYWHWKPLGTLPGGAPWTNVAGWWATATLGAALGLSFLRKRAGTRESIMVLAGHVLLMLGIGGISSLR